MRHGITFRARGVIAAIGTLTLLAAALSAPVGGIANHVPSAQALPQYTAQALNTANFILSLEDSNGAIKDSPDAPTANNDSNEEYALQGLAAAYSYSGNIKYLTGFQNGIAWLATREDMTPGFWHGSWYLQYASSSPYQEIPSPSGPGISNVRGIDTTSSLFAYLLYLDQRITGNSTLVTRYASNAQAALNFVINRNTDTANNLGRGLFYGSWLYHTKAARWEVYQEEYADDQGDDYLGMRAGALLYHSAQYAQIANLLMTKTPAVIWDQKLQMYATGLSGNVLDNSLDGYDEGMSQGYLAWMWGNSSRDQEGMTWFRSKVLASGAVRTDPNRPAYSINVGFLGMGDAGLNVPPPVPSFTWLVDKSQNPLTGGIHDTLSPIDPTEYDNVAGFAIMGLLGWQAF